MNLLVGMLLTSIGLFSMVFSTRPVTKAVIWIYNLSDKLINFERKK